MPEPLIKVDLAQSPYENEQIHNRWHPDVPMAAWVNPGDDFILETYDWTGGFIKNNDSADDVRDIDLSIVHFLTGPVGVKGAEPPQAGRAPWGPRRREATSWGPCLDRQVLLDMRDVGVAALRLVDQAAAFDHEEPVGHVHGE